MNTTATAGIIFVCLFAAVLIGTRIRRFLPEDHLSGDTKETVKLSMGLVATMSALLLGLLVSSTKSSYDDTRGHVIQLAAKVAFLDRVLGAYGPSAAEVRRQLHAQVEEEVHRIWSAQPGGPSPPTPTAQGNRIYRAIHALPAADDAQRDLKAQAINLSLQLAELRTLLHAQSISSISVPMLIVVVGWFVVIFVGFSMLAPSNATANLALMASAVSVDGAIFLILELDRPFGGLIALSSQPLLDALNPLAQ